jgi:hypothetical protein
MATTSQAKSSTAHIRRLPSIKRLKVIKPFIPDRGIPLPGIVVKKKAEQQVYTFNKFRIMDSIFFEHSDAFPAYMERDNFIHQARRFNAKKGFNWRFTSRTVKGGIRIWRIE